MSLRLEKISTERSSLPMNLWTHAFRTYPSYYSMKCQGVLVLPLTAYCWASLTVSPYPFIFLGGERSIPKRFTQHNDLAKSKTWTSQPSIQYTNLNPLTPMSDQDRISPYNINTISSRQVLRTTKNLN